MYVCRCVLCGLWHVLLLPLTQFVELNNFHAWCLAIVRFVFFFSFINSAFVVFAVALNIRREPRKLLQLLHRLCGIWVTGLYGYMCSISNHPPALLQMMLSLGQRQGKAKRARSPMPISIPIPIVNFKSKAQLQLQLQNHLRPKSSSKSNRVESSRDKEVNNTINGRVINKHNW